MVVLGDAKFEILDSVVPIVVGVVIGKVVDFVVVSGLSRIVVPVVDSSVHFLLVKLSSIDGSTAVVISGVEAKDMVIGVVILVDVGVGGLLLASVVAVVIGRKTFELVSALLLLA